MRFPKRIKHRGRVLATIYGKSKSYPAYRVAWTVAGKRLALYFNGHRLRLVAWRTPQGVYWVSNTLSLDLSNQQMLAIAASLTAR